MSEYGSTLDFLPPQNLAMMVSSRCCLTFYSSVRMVGLVWAVDCVPNCGSKFSEEGLSCSKSADEPAHWLTLDLCESAVLEVIHLGTMCNQGHW